MLRLNRTILSTTRTVLRPFSMVSPPTTAPPQFQSTPTVWPLQSTPSSSKPSTESTTTPSKSKSRNRNRKKAAKPAGSEAAPPPVPSTSNSNAQQSKPTQQPSNRTSFPWRGSGRGRGRGGSIATRGGAANSSSASANGGSTRGFSTVATSTKDGKKAGEETGIKVQRTALFQSAQQGANSRRGVQTEAESTTQPSAQSSIVQQSAAPASAPRRGGGAAGRGGGRGRGRGKARVPPGGDRGRTLLEKVKERAGEEDLEAQIQALYDVSTSL